MVAAAESEEAAAVEVKYNLDIFPNFTEKSKT